MLRFTDISLGNGDALPAEAVVAAAPPHSLSDEAIVRRVMDGDLAGFELIMRRYNQRLFRLVEHFGCNDVCFCQMRYPARRSRR